MDLTFLSAAANSVLLRDQFGKPFTPASLTELLKKPVEDVALVALFDTAAREARGVMSPYTPAKTLAEVAAFLVGHNVIDEGSAITATLDDRVFLLDSLIGSICALRMAFSRTRVQKEEDMSPVALTSSQLLRDLHHSLFLNDEIPFQSAKEFFGVLGTEISRLASTIAPSSFTPVLEDVKPKLSPKEWELLTAMYPMMVNHYTECRRGMLKRFHVLMVAMSESELLPPYQKVIVQCRVSALLARWTNALQSTSVTVENVFRLSPLHIQAALVLSGRKSKAQRELLRYRGRDVLIGGVPDRGGRTNLHNMEARVTCDIRRADADLRSKYDNRSDSRKTTEKQSSLSSTSDAPPVQGFRPPPVGGDYQRFQSYNDQQQNQKQQSHSRGGGSRGSNRGGYRNY